MTTQDMSLSAKWTRFRLKIDEVRRDTGPIAALSLAGRWSFAFVRKQGYALWARAFDARTGLSIAADYPESEFPANAVHGDAVHYAPVPPTVFDGLLRDLGDISRAEYTFIDLGCGKGAALLMALDAGFGSALGVELNARLVPFAVENVAAYARRKGVDPERARVIEADAVHVDFPSTPIVVFLYNPFGAETLRGVLANLSDSVRRLPRDVLVAYASPVHEADLDAFPGVERLARHGSRWGVWRVVGEGGRPE